jgi:hypothetical protein
MTEWNAWACHQPHVRRGLMHGHLSSLTRSTCLHAWTCVITHTVYVPSCMDVCHHSHGLRTFMHERVSSLTRPTWLHAWTCVITHTAYVTSCMDVCHHPHGLRDFMHRLCHRSHGLRDFVHGRVSSLTRPTYLPARTCVITHTACATSCHPA